MCRLNHDGGVRTTWVPVKLLNVLEDIAPDLAEQLEKLEGIMLESARRSRGLGDKQEERMRDVILTYGIERANLLGVKVSSDEITANCADVQSGASFETQASRTTAFTEVANYVDSLSSDPPPDPKTAAELRASLMHDAGLAPDGSVIAVPSSSPEADKRPPSWVLDTEIVAIYW